MNIYRFLDYQYINSLFNEHTHLFNRIKIFSYFDNLNIFYNNPTIIIFLAVLIFFAVIYANQFISDVIGILYPIILAIGILNNQPIKYDSMAKILEYFVIYGVINSMNFILKYIPFYYHFKIIFTYFLINNDFYFSNILYEKLVIYFKGIILL